ncbi:CheR family methyltransferase [Nitratireductor alexandrii]|uniref:CheR family methyltransferase n=1 Tax=Nitratireductor alexandrii TaxID=2448161 RepID=UPI001EE82276|nr:protein-glutamate O-methyltransferase [Nitratireductor alexandrii]
MPGDYVLTEADFCHIASILHDHAGIHLPQAKAALVYARLAKRLRALGLENFRDYCALVAGSDGLGERQKMVAALTGDGTKFYREADHFDHLRTRVLPALAARARQGQPIRIWSAGCAGGEEPYTIALVLLSAMPDAARHDVRLLATDIDPQMIQQGRAAIYSEAALADVPADLRTKWFSERAGAGEPRWQAHESLRDLIAFRELNLFARWPMKKRFDAIFCRNVAIYVDAAKQAELWMRFSAALKPSGVLYVGQGECVSGPAARHFAADGPATWRRLPG